ncbi:MAG: hypothetical protein LZF62_460006 [Nitrospira sp.]|nr:MAG: hypothetical protein LZF62_460006 [Nitrospira sp.]
MSASWSIVPLNPLLQAILFPASMRITRMGCVLSLMNRTSSSTLAPSSTGSISVSDTRTTCTTAVRFVSGTVGLLDQVEHPDNISTHPIIIAARINLPLLAAGSVWEASTTGPPSTISVICGIEPTRQDPVT